MARCSSFTKPPLLYTVGTNGVLLIHTTSRSVHICHWQSAPHSPNLPFCTQLALAECSLFTKPPLLYTVGTGRVLPVHQTFSSIHQWHWGIAPHSSNYSVCKQLELIGLSTFTKLPLVYTVGTGKVLPIHQMFPFVHSGHWQSAPNSPNLSFCTQLALAEYSSLKKTSSSEHS